MTITQAVLYGSGTWLFTSAFSGKNGSCDTRCSFSNTVWYKSGRLYHNAVYNITVYNNTVYHSTVYHSTVYHSTVYHSTVYHSTVAEIECRAPCVLYVSTFVWFSCIHRLQRLSTDSLSTLAQRNTSLKNVLLLIVSIAKRWARYPILLWCGQKSRDSAQGQHVE